MNKIFFYRILLMVTIVTVLSFDILLFQKNTQPITFSKQLQAQDSSNVTTITPTIKPNLFQYIEITDSCTPYFHGKCVNVRSGPSEEYPVVTRLRTGVVLQVSEIVTYNNRKWYKIKLDKFLVHPERITDDWFVADGDYIKLFTDVGDQELSTNEKVLTSKRIIINTDEQMLYAYDGDTLFMKELISTGLEFTPTPDGTFTVYKKTPSRYMQGPTLDGSDQYYDLPGVPWDLYFTYDGDVIHGTYWHNHFGKPWSHGCVNLPSDKAKLLYRWTDIGTSVIVKN